MKISLIHLPCEIHLEIADSLGGIDDLLHLAATCKTIRDNLSITPQGTITRLAFRSELGFLTAPRYILLASKARELSSWGQLSDENSIVLHDAFRNGLDALVSLASKHCTVTLEHLKTLKELVISKIRPVIVDLWTEKIDPTGESITFFDEDGDDPNDPHHYLAFIGLCLYGSLFAPGFDAVFDPENCPMPKHCTPEARIDFIKYCLPDDACWMTQHQPTDAPRGKDGRLHPFLVADYSSSFIDGDENPQPQVELYKLVHQKKADWHAVWALFSNYEGLDPIPFWRRAIESSFMLYQGYEGLFMIFPPDMKEWSARMQICKEKVAGLTQAPEVYVVGESRLKVWLFPFPDLRRDLEVTLFGYYNNASMDHWF